MSSVKIDISHEGEFNQLLATLIHQYFLYKYFHWEFSGLEFYYFHQLFDKHSDIIYSSWDLLAERLRQKHGHVLPMTSLIANSLLTDYTGDKRNIKESILPFLIDGHNITINLLQQLLTLCNTEEDYGTVDYLTSLQQDQDKMLWFLQSSI
jgi:DNA-binding ferritin-like protein